MYRIGFQYATLSYMSLYDALFLYGLAIRDAFEETRNHSVYMNGKLVWSKMGSRQFIGSTGQVLMNNKAVRVPSYATYYVRNGSMRIVVELTARLEEKLKCAKKQMQSGAAAGGGNGGSDSDCSEHVAHEVLSNYWISYDGAMPTDMPRCGYDGKLCDYTSLLILAGVVALLGVCIPLGYLVWKKE